ncbi:hypothetical protein [Roseicitreum antarcticum]|uniref:hypothetical protein n=1 Tax=Roseicitreum antarcticum TaxID=564137 RepID=UPI001C409BA0|nr:hypothetical protein [Roseicitreum antarcticum]
MIEVEPTGESGGHCDCCGQQTRAVWGYVNEDQGTVASYFMQWTVGASLETHPANLDLIYGRWGDGASSADRCAVSLLHFENENGPSVMVIDAKNRPIATSSLISKAMTRDEVIGTDVAQHAFAIFDAVITQDKRLT